MAETHEDRMARLDTYRREHRIIRNAWTREDDGRHLACLLAAYSPEAGAAKTASACPAEAMPTWVAHLTVWIDDCGTEAACGPRVDRWIEFLRRTGDMDHDVLRRLDYKVRAVCLRFCLPHAGMAAGVVSSVLALCEDASRGEPVTGEQWAAAAAEAEAWAAADAEAEAWAAAAWAAADAVAAWAAADAVVVRASASAWDTAEALAAARAAAEDRLASLILDCVEAV